MSDEKTMVDSVAILIAIEALQAMFDAIHIDQPDCGEPGCSHKGEMIVQSPTGVVWNMTKSVPILIDHMKECMSGHELAKMPFKELLLHLKIITTSSGAEA